MLSLEQPLHPYLLLSLEKQGFPGDAVCVCVCVLVASTANAADGRDVGSIPGSGRSPGEGHGNPFQYSFLENPTDRGVWWALQFIGCQRVRHD